MKNSPDSAAPQESAISLSAISSVDLLGMGALSVAFLVYSFMRSRHMIFWSDEIMGVLVLRQPTLAATLHAWRNGLDSSGIWFELLARVWTALFGFSEFSLRIFSALGICLSACILWVTARRFYSTLTVAASVSIAYTTSLAMLWQLANGRTYGLFLTAAALVLWLLFRGEDEDTRKPSVRFLLLTALAYAFLMGSHILGPLYVGGFLGIQAWLDWNARRFRPLLYLAAALSGIVLWFSRANFQATAALGKPTFWTIRPGIKDLATFDNRLCGAILVSLLLVGFSIHFVRTRKSVYLVLVGYAALDLLIWGYSRVGTSIYVNRYLLPLCFAAALLLSELMTQLREVDQPRPLLRRWFPLAFLALSLALLFVHRLQRPWLPGADYTQTVLNATPANLPLISPDPGVFVELEYYHHPGQPRVLFPVDWPLALSRENSGGVSGMHEMDNFKAEGFYAEDIHPTGDYLDHMTDFAVVGERTNLWLEKRILNDPRFVITPFASVRAGIDGLPMPVWLVHKR